MSGELIGIHSRVSASLEQNMHVPMREYLKHWDALKGNEFLGDGPFAERPVKGSGFLGFASTDTDDGLLIGEVLEDGPAANAGIETGDVILELEGEALTDKEHFQSILKEKTRGEEVELLIMRNGEQKKLTVKLGEK
jgi:serine protease Do